jgi:hypothetical protein
MRRGSTPPPGFTFLGTFGDRYNSHGDDDDDYGSWISVDIYIKN